MGPIPRASRRRAGVVNLRTRLLELLGAAATTLMVAALASCGVSTPSKQFDVPDGGAAATGGAGGAATDGGAGGGGAPLFGTDGGTTTGPQYPMHPWPTSPSTVVTVGAVPQDVANLFAQAPASTASPPALAYPAPDTFFPPNIADILFQWSAPSGNVFWVHFAEGSNTLDVYTDGSDATCAKALPGVARCWQSTASDLMLNFGHAADTASGVGGTVTFSIASLDTTTPGAAKHVSPTYTLNVARLDISGAIFYWSTTAQGIRRGTFDAASAGDAGAGTTAAPIDYLTEAAFPPSQFPPGNPNRCFACHTLSRDGKKMSSSFLSELAVVDIVPVVPPPLALGPDYDQIPATTTQALTFDAPSMWSTFSPDTTQIVTVSNATMTLRDSATGQVVVPSLPVPSGTAGTMPDWSPDGTMLAFADVPMTPINAPGLYFRHLYGSSIAMLSVQGSQFSGYQIVAQSTKPCASSGTTESYANPFFSQDSKWVVYSRGDCQSEADPTSEVILSPAVPSAPQNHLVTANQATAAGAVTGVENGMPILGPTPENLANGDPNKGLVWVAFTSTRDYGLVLSQSSQVNAPSTTIPSYQVKQIWLAAVDLNKLASGVTAVDPSYPAFRFPAQDLDENTHRPFWTADALKGQTIVVTQ